MKRLLLVLICLLPWALTASAAPINFNDYTANAYKGQPGYPNQGIDGSYDITHGGNRLKLHDDIWLNFEIPVTVTANTWMHIEVRDRAPQTSEILGLQFLDTFLNPALESKQAFAFAGSQTNWGITDYRTSTEEWESFDINIGAYFTGDFGGIVFFTDDDRAPVTAEGRFRNLEFSTVPEPTTMLLFGLGLLGVAGVSRKQ